MADGGPPASRGRRHAAEPDPVAWVRERWTEQERPGAERFAAAASLMRAHAVVVGRFDAALRPVGCTRTTYLALVTLALPDEGRRTLASLTRSLMVHPTTVTQLVDGAERRGWVRREPHPTDRRASYAVLQPAGRELLERATAALDAVGFGLADAADTTLRDVDASLHDLRRELGDL